MSAKQQVPGPPGPHTSQLCPDKENQGEVFDKGRSSETVPPTPYPASWGLLNILILPNARPTNGQGPVQEAITHTLRNLNHRNSPGDTCKTQERGEVNCNKVHQKLCETYTNNNKKSDMKLIVEPVPKCLRVMPTLEPQENKLNGQQTIYITHSSFCYLPGNH